MRVLKSGHQALVRARSGQEPRFLVFRILFSDVLLRKCLTRKHLQISQTSEIMGIWALLLKSLKVKCGATDFSTCVYTSLLLVVSKKLVWFDRIS